MIKDNLDTCRTSEGSCQAGESGFRAKLLIHVHGLALSTGHMALRHGLGKGELKSW